MSDNPYAPRRADPAITTTAGPIYSPNQVAVGALLGGPVGLIHFLRTNFLNLNNDGLAKKSLIFGAALIVVLLLVLPLLPEKFPSLPFSVAYAVIGQQVATRYQLTRTAIASSPDYVLQSNWRVLGRGLLCLFGSMVVIFTPIFLFGLVASASVR